MLKLSNNTSQINTTIFHLFAYSVHVFDLSMETPKPNIPIAQISVNQTETNPPTKIDKLNEQENANPTT